VTESLFDTYVRLKKNVIEATETFEKEQTATNARMRDLTIKAFKDFCVLFTENMMTAVGQTIDEARFL
jgi:hypothetical protein